MGQAAAHSDVSRVETARRVLLDAALSTSTPFKWKAYGDSYEIG